ncbi:metal-dependent hydrolase [Candidatus Micrarchaeota archaeon]|nr:metal-dependent hydrolase [Candidatus Micrarchaeota archaeon]
MNWRPHFTIGAFAGAIVALALHCEIFIIFLAAIIGGISALAPDIDHDSSKIRKAADLTVPIFGIFFALSSSCYTDVLCITDNWKGIIVSALAITGLYTIVITYLKPSHRGIIHSLLFALAYFAVLYAISDFAFALFGFVGYASHLLADGEIKLA